MVVENKELCRLLKYSLPNIYEQSLPTDDECLALIKTNIILAPKIPEIDKIKGSFITILFEGFILEEKNNKFVLTEIDFDVLCPNDDWYIDGESLRPFLMMAEIDEMFNNQRLNNVGVLRLTNADRFTLSADLSGYNMKFKVYDFN